MAAGVLAGVGMFNRFGPDWQAALGGVGSPTGGLMWIYWTFGAGVTAATGIGLWLAGRWTWVLVLGALAGLPPVAFQLSSGWQASISGEVSIAVLDSCGLASAVWTGLGVAAVAQHLVRIGQPVLGALIAGFALGGAPAFGSALEHLLVEGVDLYPAVLFATSTAAVLGAAAALAARAEPDLDPKVLWTVVIGVVAAATPLVAGWVVGSARNVGDFGSGAVLAVSLGLLLGGVVLALPLGWRAMAWVAVIALALVVLRFRLGRLNAAPMDTVELGAYALVGLVVGLGALLPRTRQWVAVGVCAALAAFVLLVAAGDPLATPVVVAAVVAAIVLVTGGGMLDLAATRSAPLVLITLAAMASAGAFVLRIWTMVGLPFGWISPLDVPNVFDAVALVVAAGLLALLARTRTVPPVAGDVVITPLSDDVEVVSAGTEAGQGGAVPAGLS